MKWLVIFWFTIKRLISKIMNFKTPVTLSGQEPAGQIFVDDLIHGEALIKNINGKLCIVLRLAGGRKFYIENSPENRAIIAPYMPIYEEVADEDWQEIKKSLDLKEDRDKKYPKSKGYGNN